MFLLLVAALLGTAVNGRHYNRIIGGYECSPNSKPWQATLHYFTQHNCGGVLIDKQWVLTAAHCQLQSIQIRLGEHDLDVYEGTEQFTYASKICPHSGFNARTYENDIMLLKLPEPVTLNEYVQTIDIACPPPTVGTRCLVSGWGTITSPAENYPNTLQCAEVEIVSESVCKEAYSADEITDDMLCAGILRGGIDTCQGDSGGPLVCDGKLYGITSWGHDPCAEAGYPGIYTKICNYLDWIQETKETEKDCLA
ncbi:trypsin-like [Hyperolius riggenbachi]|uniref:trypsin-like n=1 Tax=Hyperolius riggenbachi TaxID=752182 RepID=UPI0035A29AF1